MAGRLLPKTEGGLGLKCIREANEVSVLKLFWRVIAHKNSLWSRWIHEHLLQGSSLWALREPIASSHSSWVWRQLLKMRDQAKDFIKIKVHNGRSTSFWLDRWNNMGNLAMLTGDRGRIDLGISAHATVEQASVAHRRRRHRTTIYNGIEDELDPVRQDYNEDEENVVLWRMNQEVYKPKFVTKHTWEHIRSIKPKVSWAKGIWFSRNTPKFASNAWVTVLDRLPTGARMQKWNANISADCVLCHQHTETRDHLYFLCPYSKQVWENMAMGLLMGRNPGFANQFKLAQIAKLHDRVPVPDDSLSFMERKEHSEARGFTFNTAETDQRH